MVRKRGFTTKWTPLPPGGGTTGINTAHLEQGAVPLNAADYYSLLPEQLIALVEYKIPGDVVNDYATFTNRTGDETFWLTRKRAANESWENATRVTSPTVIARLDDNAVARYSTAQHGTTLDQADLDAYAAELQASLAELPTGSILRKVGPPFPEGSNEDVLILQSVLEQLSESPVAINSIDPQGIDGFFGPDTETAVIALQNHYNNSNPPPTPLILVDGIVGPQTWDVIRVALSDQSQARLEEQAGTGGGILPNIKGENIMNLLFCLLEIGMQEAATGFTLGPTGKPSPDWENFVGSPGAGPGFGPGSNSLAAFIGNPVVPGSDPLDPVLTYVQGDPDPRDPRNSIPDELKDNLFPRINMDGVDFTGTLLGLLMLPPGPFGIVYLLLMLLGKELEDALTPDEDGTGTNGPQLSEGSAGQSGEPC